MVTNTPTNKSLLLAELQRHPQGITSNEIEKILGFKVQGVLSKLHAYDEVDRVEIKRARGYGKQYRYMPKPLPVVEAPPSAAQRELFPELPPLVEAEAAAVG